MMHASAELMLYDKEFRNKTNEWLEKENTKKKKSFQSLRETSLGKSTRE